MTKTLNMKCQSGAGDVLLIHLIYFQKPRAIQSINLLTLLRQSTTFRNCEYKALILASPQSRSLDKVTEALGARLVSARLRIKYSASQSKRSFVIHQPFMNPPPTEKKRSIVLVATKLFFFGWF